MLKGKIRDRSDLKIWAPYKNVEFKDGGGAVERVTLEIEIRHTTRAHSLELADKCRTQEWSNEAGTFISVVDKEKYYKALGSEVVTGWRGLTPEVLRTLCDMTDYPETEVPYSPSDAAELLQKVHGLDSWVQTIARNVDHYVEARRAAEIKNS